MSRPAFLQKEPLTRMGLAFLLTVGIVAPLLLALDLGGQMLLALAEALGLLALLTALSGNRKTRILLWVLLAGTALTQLFLPHLGLLGGWVEGFKALALYFSGYSAVLPLFGSRVASLLALLAAALGYVFARRGVGFVPAAMVVVLTLFGLWSLGRGDLLWYTAPALVALLLMMAQSAHEKINVLHVLPMALAAVLAALLLTPASRVVFPPLSQAASDMKQTISDYLFFTKPRDVFTLGAYGFYPMGSGQLGGPAEPGEYPVMMVKTERKTLLRAVSKDYYDGRSFTDTSGAKRYLYINPRWQAQRRRAFMELLPGEAILKATSLLDQKAVAVQMENSAASTVVTPLFLRSLNMENDMVPYFNDASELFITRDLQRDDRYTVYAPVLEGGDAGLDAVVTAAQKDDAYYSDISQMYTQLPNHMEQKVFDDVKSIVAGESTSYGKAMAIMRHLQKYYRYTLTPDTPPTNKDFVTYFLYVGKEGYCTYYASAMTVMCRMAGLPARYVEGFEAQPTADGFAYVTGKDAHAWTEVYFQGFGWVPFDPTPEQENGNEASHQNEPSPEPTISPTPNPQEGPTATPNPDDQQNEDQPSPEPTDPPPQDPDTQDPDMSPQDEQNNTTLWLALAILALLAALAARVALRSPERVAARKATEREKIFVYGAAVQRLLNYAKRKPKPGETPLAFAKRIDGVHAFPTQIMPLWRIMALSNYSRLEPGQEQTRRARDCYRAAFGGANPLRRLRFRLATAFDPRLYRALDTPAPHDKPPAKTSFKAPRASGRGKAKGGQQNPPGRRPPDDTPPDSTLPNNTPLNDASLKNRTGEAPKQQPEKGGQQKPQGRRPPDDTTPKPQTDSPAPRKPEKPA